MSRKRNASKTVSKVASGVETAAEGVKSAAGIVSAGARTVKESASKAGNYKHRATRNSKRPDGVITRRESTELPAVAARLFCNPLDDKKLVFGKPIQVHPAGLTTTTQIHDYFSNYVYAAYSTAIIQVVRYNLSTQFTEAQLRSYINQMSYFYFSYKAIAIQRAFMTDGETVSQRMNVRVQNLTLARVEQALKNAHFVLQQYVLPPKMFAMIDWLSDIYALGRTPNANIAQFITKEIQAAPDAAALADILVTMSNTLTDDDRRISALLGKLFPSWRMKPKIYVDMSTNAKQDFNWLNVWFNMGYSNAPDINPVNAMDYTLFNDNPNAMCTALSTLYNLPQAQWEPGLLSPEITASSLATCYIDDTTGLYTPMLATNPRVLGALRQMEYQPSVAGTFIGSEASPEAKTMELTIDDMTADSSTIMHDIYHVDEVVASSTNAVRY